MTRCKVCNNPNRSTIDRELMAGVVSDRSLAAQFNVSKQSLGRHRAHIQADLDLARSEAAHERVERLDTYSTRMRDRMESKLDILDQLLSAVQSNMEAAKLDPRLLLASVRGASEISRELRGWCERIESAQEGRGDRAQVVIILPSATTCNTPPEKPELREAIILPAFGSSEDTIDAELLEPRA